MMELTKERLKEIAQCNVAFGKLATLNEVVIMAEALLAGLEQEPVAWVTMQKEFCDDERTAITNRVDADRYSRSCYDLTPLYAAPQLPQPAVPDEAEMPSGPGVPEYNVGWANGWNSCREEMLQGAEPVTTACKFPDDFDFDRFNDVVWLEAVASNPHMHSPTTSTIAMVALELNKRLETGNPPVITDDVRRMDWLLEIVFGTITIFISCFLVAVMFTWLT